MQVGATSQVASIRTACDIEFTHSEATFKTMPLVGRNAEVIAKEFKKLVDQAGLGQARIITKNKGPFGMPTEAKITFESGLAEEEREYMKGTGELKTKVVPYSQASAAIRRLHGTKKEPDYIVTDLKVVDTVNPGGFGPPKSVRIEYIECSFCNDEA